MYISLDDFNKEFSKGYSLYKFLLAVLYSYYKIFFKCFSYNNNLSVFRVLKYHLFFNQNF